MAAPETSNKLDTLSPAPEQADLECLSDDEVLAFASGTLDAKRHAEAHVHFDQCQICQRLLSEAAHALATSAAVPFIEGDELSWHTTFQPGTLVGHRYLIRHFIARGGMGEVYEAFDRDLQERVALKTVTSTACDNASAVRRLKAEVQLARRVSHPNVCRIYDFGTHVMAETGTQISFLTMEFVEGETLGQRVRLRGALPIQEARKLGQQLLRGLSAAHEAGILHRDFKSENVMLRAEADGACWPLILDFGLARALDEASRHISSANRNLLGTFGYIAPEQLQDQPHSTASDVYSFGTVWFEMLTGELPFDTSSSSAVGSALARLQGPAPAPSSRNPLVPPELDAVVLGCLRRSPKDRYRTAGEVLRALEAIETRSHSSFQKRKLLSLSVAAVLGAIIAYVAAVPSNRKPAFDVATHAALAEQSQPRAQEAAPSAEVPRPPSLATPLATPSLATPPLATPPALGKQPRLPSDPRPPKALGPPASAPQPSVEPDRKTQPPRAPAAASEHPPKAPQVTGWENTFDAGAPPAETPSSGS